MENMNSGYHGYSMSVHAAEAYSNGEMPISKWSKQEIIDRCGDMAEALAELTVSELRRELLVPTGWHHTSSRCNITDFYRLDEDALEDMTDERIASIIAARKPRAPRTHKAEPKHLKARVSFKVWGGTRKHPTCKQVIEVVSWMSDQQMVKTEADGLKRLSSLTILEML
jgi:hypothetical protein